MAQNGARKEQITGAYELWQQAKVQEEVMRKSFERVQKLYDQKVISAQKYDETKAKYDASVAQANAAWHATVPARKTNRLPPPS